MSPTAAAEQITVTAVAYHRNGIAGEPFYACRFTDSSPEVGVPILLGLAVVLIAAGAWRQDRFGGQR